MFLKFVDELKIYIDEYNDNFVQLTFCSLHDIMHGDCNELDDCECCRFGNLGSKRDIVNLWK